MHVSSSNVEAILIVTLVMSQHLNEAKNGTTITTTCNQTLNGPRGQITTPNYPLPYPNDVSCVWVIRVPTGYVHFLHFLYKKLE